MVKGNNHECWEPAEISQPIIGNNWIDPTNRLWIIIKGFFTYNITKTCHQMYQRRDMSGFDPACSKSYSSSAVRVGELQVLFLTEA